MKTFETKAWQVNLKNGTYTCTDPKLADTVAETEKSFVVELVSKPEVLASFAVLQCEIDRLKAEMANDLFSVVEDDYEVSSTACNDGGKWAVSITRFKYNRNGMKYMSGQVTSAFIFPDSDTAWHAGHIAIDTVKETGIFPDMTQDWS